VREFKRGEKEFKRGVTLRECERGERGDRFGGRRERNGR
jgi:hypothetical protein